MEAPRQNTLASLKDIGLVIHPGRALRVCFVVPGFYHLLNPSVGGLFGGSEHRALMFARGLVSKEGYEVSAVAFDTSRPAWP